MERFIVLLSQPIGRVQWHKKGIKAHPSWYVVFIGQKSSSKCICSLLAYKQFLQTLKGVGTHGLYIWQEDSIVYWMSENPLQVGATFEHLPQYSKLTYGRRPGSPFKTLLPHHLWAYEPTPQNVVACSCNQRWRLYGSAGGKKYPVTNVPHLHLIIRPYPVDISIQKLKLLD